MLFGGIAKLLKYIEGNTQKCIFCDRRTDDIKIKGDGVGICVKCYNEYMNKRVDDYYEVKDSVRRLFAPFLYEGDIRRALHELKFCGCSAYAKPIAELVADALPQYYLYSDYDMIVPVPLHPNRFEERGYNQTELIGQALSNRLDVPLCNDVLFRIKDTKRQMTLSKALRYANVKNAFFASASDVYGKRILLTDDIYTAGATVRECAKELIYKGAEEVSAIVVCANFKKADTLSPKIHIPTFTKE